MGSSWQKRYHKVMEMTSFLAISPLLTRCAQQRIDKRRGATTFTMLSRATNSPALGFPAEWLSDPGKTLYGGEAKGTG